MWTFFETYLSYLANHPERIDSIILWSMTMSIVWFTLFKLRPRMVAGAEGVNKLFEINEQVMYLLNYVWPPIVTYSAFFNTSLDVWIWAFLLGTIGYAIGGRWIFEWALAFKTGKSSVESKPQAQ